jgi:hypothetical protein
MIGATKGPTGGFGITSLPSAGAKAPAEVGKAVEQLKGALDGLKNNPIVRQLLGESGFDSVQGKGKSEKAGKAEGGEATSEDSIKKLVEGLKKFVEALEELLGKKGAKGGEKAGAEGAGGAGGAEGAGGKGGAEGAGGKGGAEGAGGAAPAEGAQSAAPAEGEEDAKDPLSQLLKVLKQFVEQLQQLQTQLQQQGGNQNPGIVPPAGNTGIVPPTETAAV